VNGATHLDHDWFDAPLPSGVHLGEGTWLYSSFAFLHDRSGGNVSTGAHCGIYNGSFFDLGPAGRVTIGDFTAIVGAIFAVNGPVTIGSYCFVAHEVVLADSAWSRPGTFGRESPATAIADDAWIGARAVVLAGTRIGSGAVVGAATVVDFDVPDYAVVAGNPGRIVGWSRPGERRDPMVD
jgi:acetyltransferase-like isoleucine patch superfamily enzyme